MLKKLAFFLLCTGILTSFNIYGQQYGQQFDVSNAKNLLENFVKAWNSHDPKNMAILWTEDGDFINAWGKWGRGKNNVERIFKEEQSSDLNKTTMEQTIDSMRFLQPDLVFVDATSTLSSELSLPANKSIYLEHHIVYLLQKKDGTWKILSARPYALQGHLTKVK